MPRDVLDGIRFLQLQREFDQRSVLRIGKRVRIAALEFDTDRKIVSPAPALPAGLPRVPGAFFARDELNDLPRPADIKVAGNLETVNGAVVGVSFRIKLIGE